MEQQRSNTWIVLGAMVAFTLVPVLIVVGVLIGAGGGDDGTAAPMAATTRVTPSVTTDDLDGDRLTGLEASGDVRTMVEQHQGMMDQMRVNATPQMLQLMNADPMWQMMRSGEYVRLLEEHEENIDRMLARGQ
jgi:hypothetical protein